MALAIFEGYQSRFVCDDDFGPTVAVISKEAEAPIESCARERAARSLLHELGKMDQDYIFEHQAELGMRANRPGTSTHERRNDGAAYRLPVGAKLRSWQRGIDVRRDRVAAFIKAAANHKLLVTRTYPSSLVEAQHVNFRKEPKLSYALWRYKPLKRGATGRRVKWLTKALCVIKDPDTKKPYLASPSNTFTERIEKAVKSFQFDHHVKTDGVVGLRSRVLLGGMLKHHK